MDKDTAKDVPASVPSSPSTPSSSAATDVFARRPCPRCTCWMSSLTYVNHSLCVTYRDINYSVAIRCSECRSWLLDFRLDSVIHQRSLVSQGKESSASSPSMPVTTVPTTPIVSLPPCLFRPQSILGSMCTLR